MGNKKRKYVNQPQRREFGPPGINPRTKRMLRVTIIAIGLMVLGIYLMITKYHIWFNTGTQDGYNLEPRHTVQLDTPAVAQPADDGETTLYVPVLDSVTFLPESDVQTITLGNPDENTLYMAFHITFQGETVYKSPLLTPGDGVDEQAKVSVNFPYYEDGFLGKIEYRYYDAAGILTYVQSVTRDLDIVIAPPATE